MVYLNIFLQDVCGIYGIIALLYIKRVLDKKAPDVTLLFSRLLEDIYRKVVFLTWFPELLNFR